MWRLAVLFRLLADVRSTESLGSDFHSIPRPLRGTSNKHSLSPGDWQTTADFIATMDH